jgi:hypothetical protein
MTKKPTYGESNITSKFGCTTFVVCHLETLTQANGIRSGSQRLGHADCALQSRKAPTPAAGIVTRSGALVRSRLPAAANQA